MEGAADYLDHLLRSGADRQALVPYIERARKLQAECGCALGGAFASLALVAAIVGGITRHADIASPVGAICLALAAIFIAGIAGKGIGIALARLRLRLLYRELKHVYVH
jgi:hypothetical protein